MPNQKIIFLIPPCFLDHQLDFEIGLPVHLLLLGNLARNCGWDTEYYDMTLEEKEGFDSFAGLEEILRDRAVKLVGISNHTVRTSVTTQSVADFIKILRPDIKILAGGVNATFMWRELLSQSPAIDYVLRGYAQPGLRVLLETFPTEINDSIPGLAYRRSGKFHINPNSQSLPSDFPPPSFTDLDVSRYLAWTKTYPLVTHTGCAYSCNFCTSVMPEPSLHKEVHRSIEDVIKEMSQALDVGFEQFYMSSNVFTSRREYVLRLCTAMQQNHISERTTWVCMSRIGGVDIELLHRMRDAGCVNIAFGIETASRTQWRDLGKGAYSVDKISKSFYLCKLAGIQTTAFLMLGMPTQTQDDINNTVELIREIDPDHRVISFFQPFPGTPYWDDPEQYGLSDILPLQEWNFHEAPICATKYLDKNDLLNAAIRLYLDHPGGQPLKPEVDSLRLCGEVPYRLNNLSSYVSNSLNWIDKTISIWDFLCRISAEHGTRGRLIVLYSLSALLRDGLVEIAHNRDTTNVIQYDTSIGTNTGNYYA